MHEFEHDALAEGVRDDLGASMRDGKLQVEEQRCPSIAQLSVMALVIQIEFDCPRSCCV